MGGKVRLAFIAKNANGFAPLFQLDGFWSRIHRNSRRVVVERGREEWGMAIWVSGYFRLEPVGRCYPTQGTCSNFSCDSQMLELRAPNPPSSPRLISVWLSSLSRRDVEAGVVR